mgnify:CR=1 FL=1
MDATIDLFIGLVWYVNTVTLALSGTELSSHTEFSSHTALTL